MAQGQAWPEFQPSRRKANNANCHIVLTAKENTPAIASFFKNYARNVIVLMWLCSLQTCKRHCGFLTNEKVCSIFIIHVGTSIFLRGESKRKRVSKMFRRSTRLDFNILNLKLYSFQRALQSTNVFLLACASSFQLGLKVGDCHFQLGRLF